jgi:hypothetical protein
MALEISSKYIYGDGYDKKNYEAVKKATYTCQDQFK